MAAPSFDDPVLLAVVELALDASRAFEAAVVLLAVAVAEGLAARALVLVLDVAGSLPLDAEVVVGPALAVGFAAAALGVLEAPAADRLGAAVLVALGLARAALAEPGVPEAVVFFTGSRVGVDVDDDDEVGAVLEAPVELRGPTDDLVDARAAVLLVGWAGARAAVLGDAAEDGDLAAAFLEGVSDLPCDDASGVLFTGPVEVEGAADLRGAEALALDEEEVAAGRELIEPLMLAGLERAEEGRCLSVDTVGEVCRLRLAGFSGACC